MSIDVRRFHVFTGCVCVCAFVCMYVCVCVCITNSNMTCFIVHFCERQFFGLALNIVH